MTVVICDSLKKKFPPAAALTPVLKHYFHAYQHELFRISDCNSFSADFNSGFEPLSLERWKESVRLSSTGALFM